MSKKLVHTNIPFLNNCLLFVQDFEDDTKNITSCNEQFVVANSNTVVTFLNYLLFYCLELICSFLDSVFKIKFSVSCISWVECSLRALSNLTFRIFVCMCIITLQ